MLNSENLRVNESYPLSLGQGSAPLLEGLSHERFIEDNQLRILKETEKLYLVFESLSPQICPVIAMNKKGFFFQYVDTGDVSLDAAQFDILRSGGGVLMEGVMAREITRVKSESAIRSEFTFTRYCFVSVQTLSFHQKTGMEFLIRKFAQKGGH
jgi:hypothetical protein